MKTVKKRKAARRTGPTGQRHANNGLDGDAALDGLTVVELQDLRERVEGAIAKRHASTVAELRARFRELAEAAGYTLPEVARGTRGGRGGSGEAKYCNPEDRSQTWSGRGRMPGWLSSRLKAGATLEEFRIV